MPLLFILRPSASMISPGNEISYLNSLQRKEVMTMYVRLVRFSFVPGKEEAIHELAHDLIPAISAQPGCKGALCFGDKSSGEYGLFVQWDSQENADAASAAIGPRLSQH